VVTDPWLELALILAVIYCLELISILPPPRRLLLEGVRRLYLSVSGVILRNPLPWSLTFNTESFPLIFGTEGVYAYEPHQASNRRPPGWGHRFLRYDEIEEHGVEANELKLNGGTFLKLSSEAWAQSCNEALHEVLEAPETTRLAVIRRLVERRLAPTPAAETLQNLRRTLLSARLHGTLLFAALTTTLTLFVATEWARNHWSRFAMLLVLLLLSCVWEFVRVHRRLYPNAVSDRFIKTFILALNLPTACRMAEALARDSLRHHHPLAVLQTSGNPKQFKRLAKQAWLDLTYPAPFAIEPSAEARDTLQTHREFEREALSQLLEHAGVSLKELTAAPQPSSDASWGYCPRCESQFDAATEKCPDCRTPPVPFTRA